MREERDVAFVVSCMAISSCMHNLVRGQRYSPSPLLLLPLSPSRALKRPPTCLLATNLSVTLAFNSTNNATRYSITMFPTHLKFKRKMSSYS